VCVYVVVWWWWWWWSVVCRACVRALCNTHTTHTHTHTHTHTTQHTTHTHTQHTHSHTRTRESSWSGCAHLLCLTGIRCCHIGRWNSIPFIHVQYFNGGVFRLRRQLFECTAPLTGRQRCVALRCPKCTSDVHCREQASRRRS
jgi:hypothetical protein